MQVDKCTYVFLHISQFLLLRSFIVLHPNPRIRDLSRELLTEDVPKRVSILSELLDTLVQLIKRHLVLEQLPAELGLVVNVRDLGYRLCLSRRLGIELLRNRLRRALELLEKGGRDPITKVRLKERSRSSDY